MKNYTMYIDDIRDPKNKFDIIVRTSQDAINHIKNNGCPKFISFDHDLGKTDTSIPVIKFIVNMDLDNPGFIPKDFKYNIHSANICGTHNINSYLNSYLTFRNI